MVKEVEEKSDGRGEEIDGRWDRSDSKGERSDGRQLMEREGGIRT